MSKFAFIILTALFFNTFFAQAQQEVLMSIDGQEISTEEFLRVYNKNNNITSDAEKKGVDEYLKLFVNYKLKVIEAENLGYDTIKAFVNEFEGYREQLAKPYLENKDLKDGLIKEAYERSLYEIDGSHILVRCDENATPKDTLKAYKKLAAIRARVIAGEPFEEVAKATSDDPSVKNNGGNLGYFSVFRMVYPFESGAFNTKSGSISKIIRTSFGYHIIKVNDKRSSRGSIKAAHIMTRIAENASAPEKNAAKEKIDKAYLALMNGMEWNEAVAEFSENPRTKENNGEIGWLSSGQAPEEFLGPCFNNKVGEFTKPIETRGGYHIGFVMEKKPVESFEEAKEKISRQVDKDQNRKKAIEDMQYSQLKEKYKVSIFPENLDGLYSIIDSSIYKNKWNPNSASDLNTSLVQIEDKIFTLADYAKYLTSKNVKIKPNMPIETFIASNLNKFANEKLYNFAMDVLPSENADYRYLLREYHDGILLFNLTNELVWQKAQEDTTGLEEFYKNANKYQWNERITVNIYKYTNNSYTSSLPALVKKQTKKKLGVDFLQKSLCPNDSIPCISIEEKTFEKGQDSMADKLEWEKGTYIVETDQDSNYLYYVTNTKGKEDKVLSETRGLYIADYQNSLETKWVNDLRNKYQVIINNETLDTLKSELNN